MKPLGAQLIAEFVDCSKTLLNDRARIDALLASCIKEAGLTLVDVFSHQYDPIGVTSVAIIGESHVVVHTYPEAQHVSVDIFTCSNGSKAQIDLLHLLRRHFKPKTLRFIEIQRGNPLETKQQDWITSCSSYGFEVRYHVKKKLFSKKSRYQQIDVIDNDSFGRMLFLDNDLQISEKDADVYNANLVSPLAGSGKRLGRVAILGGGDGGVLTELLKYRPAEVVLIDIDEEIIRVAEKYLKKICRDSFRDPCVTIVNEDANVYLDGNDGFDAVIYDLTMHPASLTRMDRTRFLRTLFAKIHRSLNARGMLSMQCCSEFDANTLKLIKRILGRDFKSIRFRSSFIPSFCENWVFATARK